MFENTVQTQREYFNSGATRSYASRLTALNSLERLIVENEEALTQAVYQDFKKSPIDTIITEIQVTLNELKYAKKHLQCWMRPRCARTPLFLWPSRSRTYYEPLGVTLIISPWNYPLQLALVPLIGALAAGNCAILKPSELTAHTSAMLAALVKKYFTPGLVTVVEGGAKETTELLKLQFDHIFFTGSTQVGRIVAEAASRYLTPTTLELGGKSPTIVHSDADLALAARRIVWGKFINAGQTCVAPDYVYVHQTVAQKFLVLVKDYIRQFYGERPEKSPDYARIISQRHFSRLADILKSTPAWSGGHTDAGELYIEPTLFLVKDWQAAIMQEEIFGPLLPVLTYHNLDEVLTVIKAHPKPLAAYIFSQSRAVQQRFATEVSFGGGCINDVVVHLGSHHLPFGGVGNSGYGAYHGFETFAACSHKKSVIFRTGWLDLSWRYPPMTSGKFKKLRAILKV